MTGCNNFIKEGTSEIQKKYKALMPCGPGFRNGSP
jgi:hypothetical protein